ncbi:hypothetical protein, partial [Ralstonia solanacearum]
APSPRTKRKNTDMKKVIGMPAEAAVEKAQKMLSSGTTHFEWLHSGAPINCGSVDHSKRDGKRYSIVKCLASGQPLPGVAEGCRCTFIAAR